MMTDEMYMKMALSLARKGLGAVSPNPMVGAVVVKKGKVIGRGYHKRYGDAHAEVNAIKEAGKAANGADLYLNLEPCCHFGKTPPCTDAVIKSGIIRVAAGMTDPDPKVSGRGFEVLKNAGIDIKTGILEEECRRLNEGFIKRTVTGRPFVILKIAASIDGKTATKKRESKWITSEASRKTVHMVRAGVDAIMTGVGTVLADNPFLTPRTWKVKRNPLRVVVDSLLRVPIAANVVGENTLFVTTERADAEAAEALESRGVELEIFKSRDGRVDLPLVMDYLGTKGINTLMVEGGPELAASLLKDGLVDKLLVFYAPKIIGGVKAPGMIGGIGIDRLSEAISLQEVKVKRIAEDIVIEGYVHRDS